MSSGASYRRILSLRVFQAQTKNIFAKQNILHLTHKRMMRLVSNGVFHLVRRAQQSRSEHFQIAIF